MIYRISSLLSVILLASVSVANDHGFGSVKEVMAHLELQDGVQIRTEQGWTIAEDSNNLALYSFTTEGHPAHPAVFHREVFQDGNRVLIRTWDICEAEQEACDSLRAEFKALNEQIRKQFER